MYGNFWYTYGKDRVAAEPDSANAGNSRFCDVVGMMAGTGSTSLRALSASKLVFQLETFRTETESRLVEHPDTRPSIFGLVV